MERHGDYFKATKGRHFVLTEKGVTEVASYRCYKAGDFLDYGYANEYWAHHSDVENGYVIEVDDPSWVTLPGYRAVYDLDKGDCVYTFDVGNHRVFHDREMAELAAKAFNEQPWRKDEHAYVIDDVYEGKAPKPCREFNGERVLNDDYWTYDRPVGTLVEEKIAMDCANCVPPKTFERGFIQCGEPYSSMQEGMTYATFVKVGDNIWEWRGNCLKGHKEESGTPIPYID